LLPSVRAISVEGNHVYVGGRFDFAGGVRCNNIARWDGFEWKPLGDGIGRNAESGPYDSASAVYALDADGADLYVGGEFVVAGGLDANRIARWNNSSETWHQVGGGIGGSSFSTRVSAVAAANGTVYVGGNMEFVGQTSTRANSIASFDGTTWHTMGRGFNGTVFAIAVDSSGNVYAAGEFTKSGFESTNNIALWDGENWNALGQGTNGKVLALAAGANALYASGGFTTAGIQFASGIASWYDESWHPLGNGLAIESPGSRTTGYALSLDAEDLFVGGRFDRAGSASSQNVGYWFKPVPSTDGGHDDSGSRLDEAVRPDIQ
jgi:hypothetical protein